MSVTLLAPIAEGSTITTWARHSAPDLRRADNAGTEGDRRSGAPITYICRSCRAPIAADASIVTRTGFRGYKGKAALYASTLNTSLSPPSILLMDTGAHTVQEAACALCGAYLGWKIVRAHEPSEKWKEGRFLLELALLEESAIEEADTPTPVRLHPATPVSEPSTPVHESPSGAAAALRPLPFPVTLEPVAPLRPLPKPKSRPSSTSSETHDPLSTVEDKMGWGHRRSATDITTGAARGRPLGPRSLTPTLGGPVRTLSAYSQV